MVLVWIPKGAFALLEPFSRDKCFNFHSPNSEYSDSPVIHELALGDCIFISLAVPITCLSLFFALFAQKSSAFFEAEFCLNRSFSMCDQITVAF